MHGPFVSLTNDFAFKIFFKSEENRLLLNALLNDFLPLPPGAKIIETQVFDPELLPEDASKKRGILDLKAKFVQTLPSGRHYHETVNVEMQTTSQDYLPERLAFYASKLYCGQLKKGESFRKLGRVYSLAFTTFNMLQFEQSESYYHHCDIRDRQAPWATFTQALNFIVVELGKFKRPLEHLLDSREGWCYLLKESGRIGKCQSEALASRGEVMSKAVKGLWNLSQDEVMREIMEAEENQRRDQLTREEFAWERGEQSGHKKGVREGMKRGMEKGVEKGRKEGVEQGLATVVLKMLQNGLSPEEIKQNTGLSLAKIRELGKLG